MVLSKKFQQIFLEYFLPHNEFPDAILYAFTPHSINWQRKRIRGVYKQNGVWKTKLFPFPDCVINQTYTTSLKTVKRLEQALGPGKVFNRVNRLSKWKVYEILSNSKLNKLIPGTYRLEEIPLDALLENKTSLFLKPELGTLGKGIFKLIKDEAGYHILQNKTKPIHSFGNFEDLLKKVNELTGGESYLVQEEIKPKTVLGKEFFEARMIIQKNQNGEWSVTAALSRRVNKSCILANLAYKVETLDETLKALGWRRWKKQSTIKKMKKVAILTAKEIENSYGHMGEMCVDIMINVEGDLKILEVNGRPSKKLIQSLNNKPLEQQFFTNPLKYAYSLAK